MDRGPRLPGGFKVIDANGQSLAYFYARENDHDANTAGVLTMDEARRLASNFAKLPDTPMHPRVADDRVGYFVTSRFDFADDHKISPRVNYIQRWRLEKKDPAAELSEPKQPI